VLPGYTDQVSMRLSETVRTHSVGIVLWGSPRPNAVVLAGESTNWDARLVSGQPNDFFYSPGGCRVKR